MAVTHQCFYLGGKGAESTRLTSFIIQLHLLCETVGFNKMSNANSQPFNSLFFQRSITLKEDSIDVWIIEDSNFQDVHLLSYLLSFLSQKEVIALNKFAFAKNRHQYLITRSILKHLLSLYANDIHPKSWVFEKNSFGKPRVSNEKYYNSLFFNISHTDKMIAIAVAPFQEIGIDVEAKMNNAPLEIASKYFTEDERNAIKNTKEELRSEVFSHIWTLKESHIKACGLGLSMPLNSFSFKLNKKPNMEFKKNEDNIQNNKRWQSWSYLLDSQHTLSLSASHGSRIIVNLFKLHESGKHDRVKTRVQYSTSDKTI